MLVRRALQWMAGTAAILLLLFIIADYGLTPLYALFAADNPQAFADVWVGAGSVLWWVYVTASAAAAVLVALSWVTARDRFRRALLLLSSGLLLTWMWRLLIGWLDLWALNNVAEATPDFVQRATMAAVVDQLIDGVAAGLMITGGVLLSKRPSERTH